MNQAFRLDWNYFSLTVAAASLLIPFKLEDADDDWDEVTEQLQAVEWGDGMGAPRSGRSPIAGSSWRTNTKERTEHD